MQSGRRYAWRTPTQCRLNPRCRSEVGFHRRKMYRLWRRGRVEASASVTAVTSVPCAGQSVEFRDWKTPLLDRFPRFEIEYDALDATPH